MADLTHQQSLFCQKYIECKGKASEAYRQAYNPTNPDADWVRIEAWKVLQDPNIALQIEALQEEHKQRHMVTVDSLTAEYEEIRLKALASAEYAPAISAINGKAKIHGLDKIVVDGNLGLTVVKIVDMTGKKDV